VALPLRGVGKRISDYKEDVTDLLQWVGSANACTVPLGSIRRQEKQAAQQCHCTRAVICGLRKNRIFAACGCRTGK